MCHSVLLIMKLRENKDRQLIAWLKMIKYRVHDFSLIMMTAINYVLEVIKK